MQYLKFKLQKISAAVFSRGEKSNIWDTENKHIKNVLEVSLMN